ncbi:MAG TPA: formyltransferase family protein, partial [Gammaproteobacteria bacterium]|nr:formyltransferase family protein [Gammaproteobacteria bacterium]
MIRLGILGSTRGTVMTEIVSAIQHKKLNAEIAVVISNKSDALILEKANNAGIPAQFIDPQNLTREEYDEKVSRMLQENQVDLIVLVGYMRILSNDFVKTWENKIINVHPSLLPDFGGMMDLTVHQAVITAAKKESGCTVHFVTEN